MAEPETPCDIWLVGVRDSWPLPTPGEFRPVGLLATAEAGGGRAWYGLEGPDQQARVEEAIESASPSLATDSGDRPPSLRPDLQQVLSGLWPSGLVITWVTKARAPQLTREWLEAIYAVVDADIAARQATVETGGGRSVE